MKVFISYAREDHEIAERLYEDLQRTGVTPWLDCRDLLPGQDWKVVIREAIQESSYFLALLSSNSITKKGFVQKELKMALDLLDTLPPSEIFIIPAHLDNCKPNDERLQNLHWADFLSSYENGLKQVLRVLHRQSDARPQTKPLLPTRDDTRAREKSSVVTEELLVTLNAQLIFIPGGEFMMGSEQDRSEVPVHPVYVPDFHISRYPVTNEEYKIFIQDTDMSPPPDWSNNTYPETFDRYPVTRISWYDALAFCQWLRKKTGKAFRLPTEAEWEKAAGWDPAAGRKRVYPWGDEWNTENCNSLKSGLKQTTPVDRYSPAGDSPYGVADIVGNVWEWCSSQYRLYPYQSDDGREELSGSHDRVLRGGSFFEQPEILRCTYRFGCHPKSRNRKFGFRIAV
jgi:formylglycine-generating enzyme required for sulfatase activity